MKDLKRWCDGCVRNLGSDQCEIFGKVDDEGKRMCKRRGYESKRITSSYAVRRYQNKIGQDFPSSHENGWGR